MITETPAIAEAVDAAGQRWPEIAENRSALIKKLLEAGSDVVTADLARRRSARLQRIKAGAGRLTGVFPENALDTLRHDWPD